MHSQGNPIIPEMSEEIQKAYVKIKTIPIYDQGGATRGIETNLTHKDKVRCITYLDYLTKSKWTAERVTRTCHANQSADNTANFIGKYRMGIGDLFGDELFSNLNSRKEN